MKTLTKLTADKFKEIYTNERFRNEVAFAHGCYSAYPNSQFKYFKTCGYPDEYIVTEEQITEATAELERAKRETFKKHKNTLLFVGMGMSYEPRYEGDVCNHRIRTEFKNRHGHRYFIELGTMGADQMRCDHSIDRNKQDECRDHPNKQHLFYNFANLERNMYLGKYTLENVLNLVNDKFDCRFTEIVIDNYNIHCDDQAIICESPKEWPTTT